MRLLCVILHIPFLSEYVLTLSIPSLLPLFLSPASLSSLFTAKIIPHSIPLHQVTDGGRAVINKGFLTSVERRKRSVTKTYDDAFYKGMANWHTELCSLFFLT